MTKLLRVSMLLLCFIAGISASSAEKLYLSSIECVRNSPVLGTDEFTYEAYFLYDEDDKVYYFNIRRYMDELIMSPQTQILPESSTFVITPKYQNEKQNLHIKLRTTYGQCDEAEVWDEQLEPGITTYANVRGDYFNCFPYRYDLYSEYNTRGHIVNIQRKTIDIEENFTYEYTYGSNDYISKIECKNSDDTVVAYWLLEYYDDGQLKQCKSYEGIKETTDDGIKYTGFLYSAHHEFYYYDENVYSPDDIVVSLRPLTFFYDALKVNPKMQDTFTLYLPECIANILWNQKGKKLKTIRQKVPFTNSGNIEDCNEDDGLIGYWFEFECIYQATRPAEVFETIADDKETVPVYYNIQGMQVSNPAEGEIYIVRHGSKASKEIFHQ